MMTPKQARKRVGLGLRELARNAGVSKDIVLNIETKRVALDDVGYGRVIRIFRALRRAGLTGVRLDDVFPVSR